MTSLNTQRLLRPAVCRLLSPVLVVVLSACGGQPTQPQTLADIDVAASKPKPAPKPADAKRSKTEIKQAYYDFLNSAAEDDEFRLLAATRIAEIELEGGGAEQTGAEQSGVNTAQAEADHDQTVRNTIKILNKALADFPDAPGNDHTLYQLAKAYGQVGEADLADATLQTMVRRYPTTRYYTEAQFRLAESAFVQQNYEVAERAYGAVLKAPANDALVEKALFKRGWSRFKQELYEEALSDYYAALAAHGFVAEESLSRSEQELFAEYFRAIGLAFAYLGGAPAVDDYFAAHPQAPYAYRTYREVSDLLLKQERYSDAVDALVAYGKRFPQGERIASADMQIIAIWDKADFFKQFVAAVDHSYRKYHPDAKLWQQAHSVTPAEVRALNDLLRKNAVLLANYYHNLYHKKPNQGDWSLASQWYERYLASYPAYARQDKIYPLYAELLERGQRYEKALEFYELAAFDGDIVLEKESAYAAVVLSARLHLNATPASAQAALLNKHLHYALLYGQLYPGDPNTVTVIQHAVELAFKDRRLAQTVLLANLLPDSAPTQARFDVGVLKAQAYFDQAHYEDAEVMYQDLLVDAALTRVVRDDLTNKLALAIYKQGEVQVAENPLAASQQFLRVQQLAPSSELAPTALYDAAAIFIEQNMWDDAITHLKGFQALYPRHRFSEDVGKKLSVAYLNADRGLDAAREFEKLATVISNEEEKMAALWQAAELYQQKNELDAALRAFKEYAHNYPRPYATHMEAMQNITDIYQRLGDRDKRLFWLNKITQADAKAAKSSKTPRTEFIAANASFARAESRRDDFTRIRLVHPLARSLQNKKAAMQEAVKFYGQATVYGNQELVTPATFAIGKIYRDFAMALLASERPKNLNDEELEQYNILLEDQAFPFEDKAIEFYETNVTRIADGTWDDWIQQSLGELAELFPARYARAGKVEAYVEQLP